MMTSPNPTKSMENLAITIPEEEKTCPTTLSSSTSSSSSITTTTTSSTSSGCLDTTYWFKNVYGQCIKYFATKTQKAIAKNICESSPVNGQILEIKDLAEASQLYSDMGNAHSGWLANGFDMNSATFWLDIESDSGQHVWGSDGSAAYDSSYFKATTGSGACVSSKADINSANTFEFNKGDCNQVHNFFCMTGATSSAAPASKSPTPTLPKFPCTSSSKRKKRQAGNDNNAANTDSNQGSNNANQNDDQSAQTNGPALPMSIQRLNLLLDPNKAEEREKKAKEARESYDDNFGKMDLNTTYPSVFQLLWYSQLPCFDVKDVTSNWPDQMSIIKSCSWKGKKISCTSIFQMLPTDRGMCCSFNMKKAEEIFQKTKYAELVQKFQNSDKDKRY